MKKTLFYLMLLSCGQLFAQFNIHIINVVSNDLVYDANTNRIYVTIPSSNGSNGNSIGIINPQTYELENTVFIGSEPTVMAITDDGQYIYTGFAGSSTVRRFNVSNQTAGLQFPLGNDPFTGAFYAEDIETLPGNPNAVAVSRMNLGFSPRHEGVAIYDNGVARPMTTQDHTGSNQIEFSNANTIIGYNNETTEFGLRRISVSAGGVNEVSVSQNLLSGFYLSFAYHDNYVYGTNGIVVDMASSPFVAGYFNGAGGPVVYDEANDLVCYVTRDFSGVLVFQMFNPNTFLLQEAFPINDVFGFAYNVVTCGNDCYAFNTEDNKVVILNKQPSNSTEPTAGDVYTTVYPNPATNYFSVLQPANDIASVSINSIDGKLRKTFTAVNYGSYDIGDLENGIYLVKIEDKHGGYRIAKLIK